MRTLVLIFILGCTATPQNRATGELGAWQAGPALPTPRANHCSVTVGDWLLVIGGNHQVGSDFVKTDEIHATRVAADGTLAPWQLAGHTPSPVSECTATADGSAVYLIDGLFDRDSDGRTVWRAAFDPAAGTLGAFSALGALPAGIVAISSEATVHDGALVVMDSRVPAMDGTGNDTIALRTPLAGAPSWAVDPSGIDFRAQAQYAFTSEAVFVLGGYHEPAAGALADVFVAPLGAGGVLGAAGKTTSLPAAVAFGEAVAVDDWLFVAGGRAQVFGAPGTTAVYAAPITAAGNAGEWQTATALPVARTNHDLALVGDFLVLTGGAAMGPGDATVLIARVRYPGAHG